MSDDSIQDLNDRLIEDAELRDRFREDPVTVVKEAGIDLSPEQEARLLAEEWLEKTEEELLSCFHDPGVGDWF